MQLAVKFEAVIRAPNNPITILRCLRNKHDDGDCTLYDHIDVVDFDFDMEFR